MGSKVWLMFLLFALAMAAEASWDLAHFGNDDDFNSCSGGTCSSVEDLTEALMMDSEMTRRQLAGRKKFWSYDALKPNSIPCNRRGNSYYNCQDRKQANPYNRGCTVITHCYRFTD
ncbi:Rapid ALkalinization Factor [Corchorus olitorius]|uniref:Rapid ALkalinization Factor n=1 Tax=Corchorus olitorius TaxID=93759 RepID=A0A1R3H4E9_9ROSI|nr:Rapid ALkalinization Factor [Corchorus olitorius]